MNVEKLIISVQSRNALWNQKLKDYHNRNLIKRLWEEVGQEINHTAAEVKTKWRTIRDNFRKELNKIQGRSGASGGKKPKWIYFEAMSFLTDTMTSRPTSGNIPMTDEDSVMQSQGDTVSNQSDDVTHDEEEKDNANEDEVEREEERNEDGRDELNQNFRTPIGEKRVNEEKIAFQSKKKKKTNLYDRLLAVEEQKLDKLTSMCSTTDKDNTRDSDYMFLMSLLPHMKSLSSLRNLYMRQQIQQLFINEEEKRQASINTTGYNAVQSTQMSPAETSSSNTFSSAYTYSSQTPSPATNNNNFTRVTYANHNLNQGLTQPSDDINIQRYFHTFN